MRKEKAFTLTELMVVVILIGIIAAFALPNYQKSIRKAHERDAIVQLMAIHAACKIYYAQAGHFLETPAGPLGIQDINSTMSLNVIANGMIYEYFSSDEDHFEATAQWDDTSGGGIVFTVRVNQDAIDQEEGSVNPNPCCVEKGGVCPSLPECQGP